MCFLFSQTFFCIIDKSHRHPSYVHWRIAEMKGVMYQPEYRRGTGKWKDKGHVWEWEGDFTDLPGTKFLCERKLANMWYQIDLWNKEWQCVLPFLLFSCWLVSDFMTHELYHAKLPCPSLSPGVCSDSCPLSQWCYLTVSFSPAPFSFSF